MPREKLKVHWVAMYFRAVIILLWLQTTFGFQDCPSAAVGLADKNIIPDSSFTASSELRDEYAARKARFTSDRCWQPSGNAKVGEYLQIDLGKVFVICAVATKGSPVTGLSEWTTKYRISTSLNGSAWTYYPDNNNIKIFKGNTDGNTAVKNVLNVPVLAKLIRFIPTKWRGYKALRVELYGISKRDTSPVLPSPSLVNVRARSAIVAWTYPVNTSYVRTVMVKYWSLETTKTVNISYPATNLTIIGLSACTDYNVTIRAVSELGGGPWSNVTKFRTDSQLPNYAPTGVTAQAKSSRSILVTWQNRVEVRCSPNGYKVTLATRPREAARKVLVSNNTFYTLTNLSKWTDYYIWVQAYNEKGDGPPSNVVKQRTLEDKPDAAPVNFQVRPISSTVVRVSWNLPPENKRNGIIRGFKVHYCKTSAISCPPGSNSQINIPGNSTFHYMLGNLDMDTEYTFKILAYTIKDGPYSNPVTAKTRQIEVKTTNGSKIDKNPQEQQDCTCVSEKISFYVSLAINVVLIVIIITLLFYIHRLRNRVKAITDSGEKVTSQDVLENTGQVPRGGIPMNDVTTASNTPEYEAMD